MNNSKSHSQGQTEITREIGIDMGHRVTYHGSKCRNMHGHRYTIIAHVTGMLASHGEEEGMVMDFGFLKQEMMDTIDSFCDHGFAVWIKDIELLQRFFNPDVGLAFEEWHSHESVKVNSIGYGVSIHAELDYFYGHKLFITKSVPTAENLAAIWFEILKPRINARSNGRAELSKLVVWETPNSSASYPS